MSNRLGIDVGNTSTDLLLFDDGSGALYPLKTPTTPDPLDGIAAGVRQLLDRHRIDPALIEEIVYATAIAGDRVREGRNARVGLLTSAGFEQLLYLGQDPYRRQTIPAPGESPPLPLIGLEFTRGIRERMSAHGDVLTPLDEAQARACVRALLDAGVDGLAVCLLHAYANPAHERRLQAIIAELGGPLPVALSSEVLPEPGEYRRALATALDAQLAPAMRGYLARLEQTLAALGLGAPLHVASPDGSWMSTDRAVPFSALQAGPAGGAAAAAVIAAAAGWPEALGIDIGGGGAGISLLRNGEPIVSRQATADDEPLDPLPSIGVHRAALGGRSVARSRADGALSLANSATHPVCYGQGGEQPTVTDANLVLGRLPASLPLAGRETELDARAAAEALGRIGRPLGLDAYQTAAAVVDLFNETLFSAQRLACARHGVSPDGFALVAFGGAGPLHGNALAMLAACYPLIIPPTPGVLSALGLFRARLGAKTRAAQPSPPQPDRAGGDIAGAIVGQRRVYFGDRFLDAIAYRREHLPIAARITGPALILQEDATTVIHPHHVGEIDEYLNLLIRPADATPNATEAHAAWRSDPAR